MQYENSSDFLPIINTKAHTNNVLVTEQYEQKSQFYDFTNHSNNTTSRSTH